MGRECDAGDDGANKKQSNGEVGAGGSGIAPCWFARHAVGNGLGGPRGEGRGAGGQAPILREERTSGASWSGAVSCGYRKPLRADAPLWRKSRGGKLRGHPNKSLQRGRVDGAARMHRSGVGYEGRVCLGV